MAQLRMSGKAVFPLAALSVLAVACASGNPSGQSPSGSHSPIVQPVHLIEKQNAPMAGDAAVAAVQYVRAHDTDLDLSSADDFSVLSVRTSADKRTHVRMQQTYQGLPVWGADIVVHGASGRFHGINGTLALHLPAMDLNPTLTADEALTIGKADYAVTGKSVRATQPLQYSRVKTDLVVFPGDGRSAKLAWHVTFYTELQEGITPGLWNYFVDAHTGDVIQKFNAIDTLSQASGPGGNAKVSRTWTDALDVEAATDGSGNYVMQTARLVTVNMNNATSGNGTVVEGPLDNISDAPIDDAHGFAEVTLNMLQDWMGHNSIDDNGFVIRSRVHYDTNYENAYWDGTQMTYGDGASTFYPLSGAVDVVAHEIDHGYTSFHSNLTYSGMSGGMNESFSDVAGTIAEFYSEGDGADFLLGEDIFKSQTGALRYMCDPTLDGASIDNAGDYAGQDVHYTSGVGNKAFCHAARLLATGDANGTATVDSVKRAGQAWYEANASYWTASTDFTQACQGVIDAATALGYSQTEIDELTQAWVDVGVYCNGQSEPINCDETITDESGTLTSPNYPSPYPNNFSHTWCIVPASGNAATLHFDAFATEQNYDFVQIRDANGQELSNTSGSTAPADATSTEIVVKFTSDGSVTANGWSASWTTGGTSNQPPTVSITEPGSGDTVSGNVTVSATAADSDGTVARVSFELPDGTTVDDTSAPYSVTWDSTTVADGTGYTIRATAYDNIGEASSPSSITVDVSNGTQCTGGTYDASDVPINIPDSNSTGITSNLDVSGAGAVSSLTVSLDITHTWRGDLVVTLISPAGTQYVLSNRSGGSADNLVLTDVPVMAFDGETAAGAWHLKVQDLAYYDVGTLNSWSLTINGDCGGGGGGGTWAGSASPNLPTQDNGTVCNTVHVTDDGDAADAQLDINGTHAWRSILRGTLEHNGTTVEAFPTGTFPSGSGTFSFQNRPISGLSGSASGDWTLCIVDTDGYGDTGNLASWAVHN